MGGSEKVGDEVLAARSPKRDEALRRYLASNGKLKAAELSDLVGVSVSQIRKWKSMDRWDAILAMPPDQRLLAKKKGPPYGSKNAKGNRGGPGGKPGNKNAAGPHRRDPRTQRIKTGEYATICMDTLTEEEKKLYESISCDPITLVDENIRLLKIRERRMTLNLLKLRDQKDKISLQTTHAEWGKNDALDSPRHKSVTKQEQLLIDKIIEVEEAISRIQDRIMRTVESKCRMMERIEKDAASLDDTNAPVLFTFVREGQK